MRHILCEKQSKVLEALKEITGYTKEDGTVVEPVKFNVVAQKYSEDKAKEARRTRSRLAESPDTALLTRAAAAGGQPGVEAARRAERRVRGGGVQARQGEGASRRRPRHRASPGADQAAVGARDAAQMTPQPVKTAFGYHLILVVRASAVAARLSHTAMR